MVTKKITKKKKIIKTKRVVKKKAAHAKKPTIKRTSPKKKVVAKKNTGTKSKRKMVSAPLEKCFLVHNGPAILNLQELEEALRLMSNEQFMYHTAGENHFAQWVDQVLGDAPCAKALSRVKTRTGTATVVVRYLKAYKV